MREMRVLEDPFNKSPPQAEAMNFRDRGSIWLTRTGVATHATVHLSGSIVQLWREIPTVLKEPDEEERRAGGEGGSRGLQKITAVILLHFDSVVGWESK